MKSIDETKQFSFTLDKEGNVVCYGPKRIIFKINKSTLQIDEKLECFAHSPINYYCFPFEYKFR